MTYLVVIATLKVLLAAVLIAAGVAKCADLPPVERTLALFMPKSVTASTLAMAAKGLAFTEMGLGSVSLALPRIRIVDYLVLMLTCGFVFVATWGAASHSGDGCNCLGSLSTSNFGPRGVARSVLLLVLASSVVMHGDPAAQYTGVRTSLLLALMCVLFGGTYLRAARLLSEFSRRRETL